MKYNLEAKSPTIISRDSVTQPLKTGTQIIDSLFPLGKGQRQLIIGDNSTGKTSLVSSIIINQKKMNNYWSTNQQGYNRTFVIYVSIGSKKSEVAQIGRVLNKKGAAWYSTILYVSSSENCALQYIAPASGACLGQFFRDQGLNSLVIFDDLTKHAIAYRQLSLLMKKSPSKEAYPGDIFYLHSRLLERAAQMSRKEGYGTMSMLPIVETQQENFSAYIPTNVISITDGQIYLSRELFRKGLVPSVDILKSVSRIGAKAQSKLLGWSVGDLRNILFNFFNVEEALKTGQQLTKLQQLNYTKGLIAVGLWKQREFIDRRDSMEIFANLIANTNSICPNNPLNHFYLLTEYIFTKYPIFFHIIDKNINVNKVDDKISKIILNMYYKILINSKTM